VIRLLDETDAPVRILCAPAGYGKTTAARQWLVGSDRLGIWYEATSASTDLAALARGIAASIAHVIPGIGALLDERLRANRDGKADADLLAEALLADIGKWPRQAWLVIDDYQHLLDSVAGERFIAYLVRAERLQLLLLTRRRPNWLTARQLLYGDVSEFGVHALAMTSEEAACVLTSTRAEAVSGLVALAQGWPAVIGLAALTTTSFGDFDGQLPETLHTYFAEELYRAAPPQLKEALLWLSFAPTITNELAETLFPNAGEQTLEQAAHYGFLIPFGDLRYDLHPLLRKFLLAKTQDRRDDVARWCDQISNFLVAQAEWDEMFALLRVVPSLGGVDALIVGALDRFLREGRAETVRNWVTLARDHDLHSPAIDLAEAEVLFREGQHLDAEEHALSAAAAFEHGHPLRSRALYRAAQSAQLDDRPSTAIPRHEEAQRAALDSLDRRNAIWGQFVAHAELDNREAAICAAAEYQGVSSGSADDRLRQAHAKVSIAIRWGGIREALDHCRQCVPLLEQRADPLIQTGFAQMAAAAFVLAAEYEDAINVAVLEETIANRVRLEFVIPHAWITRATAYIGRAEFKKARKLLADSRDKAQALGDDHSTINSNMLEAKVMLEQLNGSGARDVLDLEWDTWPTSALGAEYTAMQALANACAGDGRGCAGRIEVSAELGSQIEADALRIWAAAIMCHRTRRNTDELIDAFKQVYELGHIDSIILAYRAYPPTLSVVASDREVLPRLKEVLRAGRDYGLAKRAGIRLSAPRQDVQNVLTPRELEVVALISEGLSNLEIARTLWISESTAKVHVRHILRKLGVRTRTEAAIRAAPYLR
jgi:LuxR family transcriptional regulator, maltose regulon positive regulatory protein